jgi:phosphoserine phosphatase
MLEENISDFTGLILVSGKDRVGITESLMGVLSPFSLKILDIEQLVIRDRFILTVLFSLHPDHAESIRKDLATFERNSELDIAIDFANHTNLDRAGETLLVVIVGRELKAAAVAAVASEISQLNGCIRSIRRIETHTLSALELQLNISNELIKQVRSRLATVASSHSIDLAVELGGKARTSKRLVLMDMDSTFIQQEVIDLLARHSGHVEAVSSITQRAMRGEIDFKQALAERVLLLKGQDVSIFDVVRKELTLTTGVEKLISQLHRNGHKVGVVSGGFLDVIEPLLQSLKIDFYRANKLEINDNKLTGRLLEPVIDGHAKLIALEDFALKYGIELKHTIAIGDGANDIEMIQAAGLGIAFRAKPKVQAAADTTLNYEDLSSVLLLMGISG